MGELTLFVLKVGFLVLLWVFVFIIVFALRSDLFGQKVRRLPPAAAVAAPVVAPARPTAAPTGKSAIATRLVVTAGAKEGLEVPLPSEILTIGRSSESDLVVRDDYTSTHHARLVREANGWNIEDLDSTNGTTLAGKRVTGSTIVPLNTPVTIGTTTFELRR